MNSGMLWFYVCYFFLKIHLLWYFHFNFCVNFKGQSAGWIDAWRPIEDRMTKIYFQLYKGAFIQNLEKSVLKVQFIINEYGSCILSWLCNYLYLIVQIICKFDLIEKCIGLYNLFPELTKRDVPGFAIGGLSGGESKDEFWKIVNLSTDYLPREKPRYLMGVG